MENKENLLKIIEHYGIEKQLKYIHSEYYELDEAIIKAEAYDPTFEPGISTVIETVDDYLEHIAEELADVNVMLKQIQVYYGITDQKIKEIMQYKIERQLERINNEQK